jgi:epoxyqueuosine reductase
MGDRDARRLTARLKAEAARLGFALAGVTTPDPPQGFGVYSRWLEAGRHGEMAYLARPQAIAKRADPRLILPECKSILVLGIQYSGNHLTPPFPSLKGKRESLPFSPPGGGRRGRGMRGVIAAYARGDDYHEVLPEKMNALVSFLEAQVGAPVPNRGYTDTGPLLERELGQRAGLGWIGKNSMLIRPQIGSYFLLAEILLGVELEPDPPFGFDRCGNCTRCLDACPTACILPDRTIDARRCISYLTIELKGSIPLDLRPQIGEWIFGCDVCQQVCPWNRFAGQEARIDPGLQPRPDLADPDLEIELGLDPASFNRKFKRSPLRRAKRRGYLRNIAVALGNLGGQEAVSSLTAALNDPEPLVGEHAAWALQQIGARADLQDL